MRRRRSRENPIPVWGIALAAAALAGTAAYFVGVAQGTASANALNPANAASLMLTSGATLTASAGQLTLNLPTGSTWVSLSGSDGSSTTVSGSTPASVTATSGTTYTATWSTTAGSATASATTSAGTHNRSTNQNQQSATITVQ